MWTPSSVDHGDLDIRWTRLSPSAGSWLECAQGCALLGVWRFPVPNGSRRGQAAPSPASQHHGAGSTRVQHWALCCSSGSRTRGKRHSGLCFLGITVVSNGKTLGHWGQFTSFTNALETYTCSLDSWKAEKPGVFIKKKIPLGIEISGWEFKAWTQRKHVSWSSVTALAKVFIYFLSLLQKSAESKRGSRV